MIYVDRAVSAVTYVHVHTYVNPYFASVHVMYVHVYVYTKVE